MLNTLVLTDFYLQERKVIRASTWTRRRNSGSRSSLSIKSWPSKLSLKVGQVKVNYHHRYLTFEYNLLILSLHTRSKRVEPQGENTSYFRLVMSLWFSCDSCDNFINYHIVKWPSYLDVHKMHICLCHH